MVDPNTLGGLPKAGAPPKVGAPPNAGGEPKAGADPKPLDEGLWKAPKPPATKQKITVCWNSYHI